MIDVLVVDDQPDMRLLIRMTLEAANGDLRVCGAAASSAEALSLVSVACPTVVVLDQMMPGGSGLDIAERLRAACPQLKILLFSAYLDDTILRQALSLEVPCLSKEQLDSLPSEIERLAA